MSATSKEQFPNFTLAKFPGIYMGARDPNSRPHVCVAIALQTEQSPHLFNVSLEELFLIYQCQN